MTDTRTRTIRSHDELISYIPHLMGFHPESSLVCVSVGGGRTDFTSWSSRPA